MQCKLFYSSSTKNCVIVFFNRSIDIQFRWRDGYKSVLLDLSVVVVVVVVVVFVDALVVIVIVILVGERKHKRKFDSTRSVICRGDFLVFPIFDRFVSLVDLICKVLFYSVLFN